MAQHRRRAPSFQLYPSEETNRQTLAGSLSETILTFRPPLEYSFPIQILLYTIVCALLVVLLVHLVFTASHHYHLAPINFIFQFSAATLFLVTHAGMLIMVLQAANQQTRQWPYMFSWIGMCPLLDRNVISTKR